MALRRQSSRSLSIREMREALARLEELLSRAGELTITRRGRPIARVISIGPVRRAPSHKRLRHAMGPLEIGSENLVRADREAR